MNDDPENSNWKTIGPSSLLLRRDLEMLIEFIRFIFIYVTHIMTKTQQISVIGNILVLIFRTTHKGTKELAYTKTVKQN